LTKACRPALARAAEASSVSNPAAPATRSAVKAVPFGTGPATLERNRRLLAEKSNVSPQIVPCWLDVSIRSARTLRYISTEIADTGQEYAMMRARAIEVASI
jgi:hypothetical protein